MVRTRNSMILGLFLIILTAIPVGIAGSGYGDVAEMTFPMDAPDIFGAFNGIFVRNMGQWRSDILFVASAPYGQIAIAADGILINVRTFDREKGMISGCVLKFSFDGSNPVMPYGDDELGTQYSYFYGKDPNGWYNGVKGYGSIVYRNVWDGIDIVYRFTDEGLKYDIILSPGADPDNIMITVEGASSLRSLGTSLLIGTPLGLHMADTGLVTYQEDGILIGSSFRADGLRFGFTIGDYDRTKKVVIDPNMNVVEFSTYVGGSDGEYFSGMDVDGSGDIYICGQTLSTDFPNVRGFYQDYLNGRIDAFVFKLDASGASLIYATYIGGNEYDRAAALKVDESGNVYLTGETYSPDFPTSEGAFNDTLYNNSADFFVLKLDSRASSLIYSTYVGGSQTEGMVWGSGHVIDIDAGGNAYVAGSTSSEDFPVTDDAFQSEIGGFADWGPWDMVLFKVDPKGSSLLYATYIGGYDGEEVYALEYSGKGTVIMSGSTSSYDFPVTDMAYSNIMSGGSDAFILKFDTDSSAMDFCTFFGGNEYEVISDVEVDLDGNIYACGQTISYDLPVTDGAFDTQPNGEDDGFVMSLDPSGSSVIFCTYVGGESWEGFNSLHRDTNGDLHIVGVSSSEEFPVIPGSFQDIKDIETDGVYVMLSGDGSTLLYSTYLGGSSRDEAAGIFFDEVSSRPVISGLTSSSDFPVKSGSYDISLGGYEDVYVMKIDLTLPPLAPTEPSAGAGDRYVLIEWEEPLFDGGAPVTDYILYRGTTDIDLFELISTGGDLSYNDTGVMNGLTYFYTVRAVNRVGSGPFSDIVSARPASTPSMPENYTLLFGNGWANISWSLPNNWGGLKLFGYRLYKTIVDTGELEIIDIEVGKWYYRDVEVVNGVVYSYSMTSWNEIGESLHTMEAIAHPGTLSMQPDDLRSVSGPGFVHLSWLAPEFNGGAEIIRYVLHRSIAGGLYNRLALLEPDQFEYNDTDVTNGVNYRYVVTAVNAWGESDMSDPVEAIPISKPSEPLDIEATAGDGSITLRWSAPAKDGGSAITGYSVYRYLRDDIWEKLATTGPGEKRYVDTSLINGRNYRYFVTAKNAIGESDKTPEFNSTPLGVPVQPTALVASVGDGFVDLSWTAPSETGGSTITEYWILRGGSATTMNVIASVSGSQTEFTDTGVENGVGYFYAVRAVNALGPSASSASVYSMPQGLPDPPSAIQVLAKDGSVEILWGDPISSGGSSITHLTIYRGTSPDEMQPIMVLTGSPDTYMDTQLTNGMTYYYSLSSSNAMGEGQLSEPLEVIPSGMPSAPGSLTVKADDNGILLIWVRPVGDGGLPLVGYWIYRIDPSGKSTSIALVSPNATEFLDEGAKPGIRYIYRVTAVNGNGEGSPSVSASGIIEEEGMSSLPWILAALMGILLVIAIIAIVILLMMVRKAPSEPMGYSEPLPVEEPPIPEGYVGYEEQEYMSPEVEGGIVEGGSPPVPPQP